MAFEMSLESAETDGISIDSTLIESLQNGLSEGRLGSSGKEFKEFYQESMIHVGSLGYSH